MALNTLDGRRQIRKNNVSLSIILFCLGTLLMISDVSISKVITKETIFYFLP